MKFLKKVFFHSLSTYIIAASICVIILIVNLSLNNFKDLINYVNGFQVGGAVVFLIGCLVLVSYFGAFDSFGYAFSRFKKDPDKKYRDRYEYEAVKQQERENKKFNCVPYLVTGLFFILIGIFLMIFL